MMKRRTFFVAGLAALASRRTLGAKQLNQPPIVLGNVSLSFYSVTGAVVAAVLERLGHRVELREGTHEQIFPLLGEAKIDLMAAAWLPEGHATYWERYGAAAVEVAKLYDDARFFWAVPAYVPQADVASIEDLAKPEVAQRMTRVIQGIGQGATISVLSQRALSDYALSARGYSFRPGTQVEWLAAYRTALEQKSWIIFPTWRPQFLNRDGGLRPLHDPRGTFGGVNRAALVGPRERVDALPGKTREALARIELDIDSVTQMDWYVNVRNMTPTDAARTWIAANEDRVNRWLRGSGS